jgi:hypothetical protein
VSEQCQAPFAIQLNIEQPRSSKTLFNAKRREEIDDDTVNNLLMINKDFKDLLVDVENGVIINRNVNYRLDEVKSTAELNEVLAIVEETFSPKESDIEDSRSAPEEVVELDWTTGVTGKKPKRIVIDNQEYEVTSWKQEYISFCQYLCKLNLEQFKTNLKGKKHSYLSMTVKDLRVAFYLEEAELYLEVNLNAQTLLKNIRALMDEFNMEQERVRIFLEKS